jgi:hypothetical protein
MSTCNCDNCTCNEITLDAGYEAGMMVIGGGGSGIDITIDDVLSLESENPVQNKVVAAALQLKADKTELTGLITQDDLSPYAKTADVDTQLDVLRKQIAAKGDITVDDDGLGNVTLSKAQMDIDVTDDGLGNVSIIL